MPAPLSAPHVPLGLPPLAAPGGQIALPGSPIMLRTEPIGLTTSPSSQTTSRKEAGGLTTHKIDADSPTTTPGGQTAKHFAASSLPASPTLAMPHAAPTTSIAPHAAPTTQPTPRVALASTTPVVPPTEPASPLYLQHYSRRPWAAGYRPTDLPCRSPHRHHSLEILSLILLSPTSSPTNGSSSTSSISTAP
jgi:hypothetical protein